MGSQGFTKLNLSNPFNFNPENRQNLVIFVKNDRRMLLKINKLQKVRKSQFLITCNLLHVN
jgi:hypothetical protein